MEGFGAASGATRHGEGHTYVQHCTVIFCAAFLFPNCSSPLKSALVLVFVLVLVLVVVVVVVVVVVTPAVFSPSRSG